MPKEAEHTHPLNDPGRVEGPDPDGHIADARDVMDRAVAAGIPWTELNGMSAEQAHEYIDNGGSDGG